jgi:outer membrane protein assembly factor BamB
LWSYDTDGEVSSSPALGTEGNVYVGGYVDTFFAFTPTGSFLWSYEVGYYIDYSSPAISTDGRIYIGSAGDPDNLYAFESTGAVAWSYAGGQDIDTSPALGSDGMVYAASEGHEIFALRSNGSLAWSYMTGDDVNSSPSLASDGAVYVGSRDNRLYAFQGPATATSTPTVTPTPTMTPPATSTPTPNYINLSASPPSVNPGGTVTMSWTCDFGIWNYQGKVVHVYIAAIKNPKVVDAPSSVSDALSGNPVYLFGKNMLTTYLYTGTVKEPTFRGAVFPPSPLSGSQAIAVPLDPSLAGDWVLAAVFTYENGAYVRNDGMPVENSNLVRIQ